MLRISVPYLNNRRLITVYHRSDLADDQIAGSEPVADDVGKYYGFRDGSGWYARIILVRPSYFRTVLGIHRRRDIVIQSRIQYPGASYCGLLRSDISFSLRLPTIREKRVVGKIFTLGEYPKAIDNRTRHMLLEKLRKECEGLCIDESFIITRLKKEALDAKNRGMERIEAVKILARINGIETERQDPRFVQNNNYLGVNGNLSIQDQRRQSTPTLGALKATIELLRQRTEAGSQAEQIIADNRFPALPGLNPTKVIDAETVDTEEDGWTDPTAKP